VSKNEGHHQGEFMSDSDQAASAKPADSAAADQLNEEVATGWYDNISTPKKLAVLAVLIIIIAVILGVWHTFYFHWFEVHTGTVNESGPYYGFWSGFGSDIGEGTLFVGILAIWRHHNCHVKGCARLGRRVDGTPYVACPKHHPEHKGKGRGISLEELHRAHKAAKEATK
jgi:hypothetical protein